MMYHPKGSISSLSITTLMSLINVSWMNTDTRSTDWGSREKECLYSLALSTLSTKHSSKGVITRLQEYLLYTDVKFYILKHFSKIIGIALKGEKTNAVFIENLLTFLESLSMKSTESDSTFLCKDISTGVSN